MKPEDYRYLFIAGTTKAATTSLFSYLAAHPEVCAASIKETRFFLDANYPLAAKYRYEEGLDKYEQFFGNFPQRRIREEATPDYLYSSGTPQRIYDSGWDVRLIFSLREPISRLKSWYRFSCQMGAISQDVAFDEYVRQQARGAEGDRPQYARALEQGRYSVYLSPYLKLFGPERVHIVFYEHLSTDPQTVLASICEFAGIDPRFYDDYGFEVFNRTQNVQLPRLDRFYQRIRLSMRWSLHDKAIIYSLLRRIHLAVLQPLLSRLNRQAQEKLTVSSETDSFLNSYYKEEYERLESMLGHKLPWNNSTR